MIAANYRKHPEALALQLPLPFGWLLKWATAKPTTKALRAIRASRGAAFKAAGRIKAPTTPATPQWVKDAARRARQLAARVKATLGGLGDSNGDGWRIANHRKFDLLPAQHARTVRMA